MTFAAYLVLYVLVLGRCLRWAVEQWHHAPSPTEGMRTSAP